MSSYSTIQDGVLGDPAELSEEYHRAIAEEQADREFMAGLICGQLLGCELSDLAGNYREDYLSLADEILSLSLAPDAELVADLISRVHYDSPLSELRGYISPLRDQLISLAELILQKTGD